MRGLQRSEFSILRLTSEQFQKLQESKKIQILNVDKSEEEVSQPVPEHHVKPTPEKKTIFNVLVSARMDHDSPPRSSMALFKQFQKNSQKLTRSTSADLMFQPLL